MIGRMSKLTLPDLALHLGQNLRVKSLLPRDLPVLYSNSLTATNHEGVEDE